MVEGSEWRCFDRWGCFTDGELPLDVHVEIPCSRIYGS